MGAAHGYKTQSHAPLGVRARGNFWPNGQKLKFYLISDPVSLYFPPLGGGAA